MATRNPRSFVSRKSEKTDQKEQKWQFLSLIPLPLEVRPFTKNAPDFLENLEKPIKNLVHVRVIYSL